MINLRNHADVCGPDCCFPAFHLRRRCRPLPALRRALPRAWLRRDRPPATLPLLSLCARPSCLSVVLVAPVYRATEEAIECASCAAAPKTEAVTDAVFAWVSTGGVDATLGISFATVIGEGDEADDAIPHTTRHPPAYGSDRTKPHWSVRRELFSWRNLRVVVLLRSMNESTEELSSMSAMAFTGPHDLTTLTSFSNVQFRTAPWTQCRTVTRNPNEFGCSAVTPSMHSSLAAAPPQPRPVGPPANPRSSESRSGAVCAADAPISMRATVPKRMVLEQHIVCCRFALRWFEYTMVI